MYRVLKLNESERLCAKCGKPVDGGYGLINDEGKSIDICDDCGRNYTLEELKKCKALTEADDNTENDETENDIDAQEDLDDVVDDEENQTENPVEEKSELDKDLDELREVLVDLDLSLYRISSKEDPNNVIYIIGKVAENSNDTLMLIDTKPEEPKEDEALKPIADKVVNDEESDEDDEESDEDKKEELKSRFDFIVLPKSFDEINKLNPRYGEDITPDHEAIMDYLMNCLIEENPKAAEELQKDDTENLEDVDNPEEEDLKDED